MAKTAEKKKRKNIVQRMMFGNENKPDLTPERMKMSKWAMFKYLFFHRFGTMVALNMLTALFAVPAVLVIILFYMNVTVNSGLIPYSSNLGIGYPVVIDAIAQGNMMTFTYNIYEFAMLVPCIAVFALGVGGNLYVMRKLIWEEPTRTIKDFFRGIKKTWLASVLMGLAYGLTLLLFEFSLGYFDAYSLSVSLKALSITLSSILLVFMTLFAAFLMTQNAAFKMRATVLIRNSVLFIFGTHIMSIIFIAVGIAPVFLAFIPGITILFAMLYIFIGFSFSTLVISLYCHYCYERFLYDKVENAPAVYTKRANDIYDTDKKDGEDAVQKTKKQAPVPYKNPKKRKKSIDEGATVTPLTPTFRREDLERLQKEHDDLERESRDVTDEDAEQDSDAVNTEKVDNAAGTADEHVGSEETRQDAENNAADGDTV